MNKRILLIDDEANLRLTLAANLEIDGFEVVEAADAQEALTALQLGQFDAVLSDIRMPGMNGVDLLAEIQRLYPGLPVLLMTAFAVEELVDRAMRGGVFAMISKPFAPADVGRALANAARHPVVLVVDDRPGDARSTADTLSAVGLSAVAAGDGESALEMVKAGQVDVCVVDMVMPGLSGPEVVEKIRALAPSISVIAVSGYPVPEMLNQVTAKGAFACLDKPFEPGDLVQLVARARARSLQA